jgi:hypothetical protein
VPGRRPVNVRVLNPYLSRLQAAAVADEQLARRFMRVVAMLDHPSSLLRPGVVARVARLSFGRDRVRAGRSDKAPAGS